MTKNKNKKGLKNQGSISKTLLAGGPKTDIKSPLKPKAGQMPTPKSKTKSPKVGQTLTAKAGKVAATSKAGKVAAISKVGKTAATSKARKTSTPKSESLKKRVRGDLSDDLNSDSIDSHSDDLELDTPEPPAKKKKIGDLTDSKVGQATTSKAQKPKSKSSKKRARDDSSSDDSDSDDESDSSVAEFEPKQVDAKAPELVLVDNKTKKLKVEVEESSKKKKVEKEKMKESNITKKESNVTRVKSTLMAEDIAKDKKFKADLDKCKLFIKNINDDVTEKQIRTLSNDIFGVDLTRNASKKNENKRYGFLHFKDEKTAESNYVLLSKMKLGGNLIVVDYAGDKSKIQNKSKDSKKDERFDPFTLFIRGFPKDATESDLKKNYFQTSENVELPLSKKDKTTRVGYGFVRFKSDIECKRVHDALQGNVVVDGGQKMQVFYAKVSSRRTTVVDAVLKPATINKNSTVGAKSLAKAGEKKTSEKKSEKKRSRDDNDDDDDDNDDDDDDSD